MSYDKEKITYEFGILYGYNTSMDRKNIQRIVAAGFICTKVIGRSMGESHSTLKIKISPD
jgi:hypothetical protein